MSKHHSNPVGGDSDLKMNGDLSFGPAGGGCLIWCAAMAALPALAAVLRMTRRKS